jgi:hypothetical protein
MVSWNMCDDQALTSYFISTATCISCANIRSALCVYGSHRHWDGLGAGCDAFYVEGGAFHSSV